MDFQRGTRRKIHWCQNIGEFSGVEISTVGRVTFPSFSCSHVHKPPPFFSCLPSLLPPKLSPNFLPPLPADSIQNFLKRASVVFSKLKQAIFHLSPCNFPPFSSWKRWKRGTVLSGAKMGANIGERKGKEGSFPPSLSFLLSANFLIISNYVTHKKKKEKVGRDRRHKGPSFFCWNGLKDIRLRRKGRFLSTHMFFPYK